MRQRVRRQAARLACIQHGIHESFRTGVRLPGTGNGAIESGR